MDANRELILEPSPGYVAVNLRELWDYRELLYFLIWRDVKVRYKQTVLGAGWAIARPVVSMVVLTFIFNRLAGFSSDGVPYALFTLCGILAWNFFSEGLSGASQSLIVNTNLISKVYFPRLIVPAAAVLRGLVDLGIAFLVYILFMIYYQFFPGVQILALPLALLWGIIAALGVGLWFSAFGVKYRDIAQAFPFVVQLLFWVTPVGYSSDKVPAKWEVLYWLNPMTGVVEMFRYSLLGVAHLPVNLLILSAAVSVIAFVSGVYNFRRMEKEFADVI
ncbi:MAG: type transporter [Geobacteraceae bacterium]|jgi:lipopolysaccharide transport system permease protein|nr:type transporter [Geobacteraceae bacterium]